MPETGRGASGRQTDNTVTRPSRVACSALPVLKRFGRLVPGYRANCPVTPYWTGVSACSACSAILPKEDGPPSSDLMPKRHSELSVLPDRAGPLLRAFSAVSSASRRLRGGRPPSPSCSVTGPSIRRPPVALLPDLGLPHGIHPLAWASPIRRSPPYTQPETLMCSRPRPSWPPCRCR
jgi:hypothetical protein